MFKQYRRKGFSEMRPVTQLETEPDSLISKTVSISDEDLKNGSPKLGDYVARNPTNHKDQWLVAAKYFEENLELVE